MVRTACQVTSLLAARGINDLSLVSFDPWSVHAAPCEGRLIQLFTYSKSRWVACRGLVNAFRMFAVPDWPHSFAQGTGNCKYVLVVLTL
jgi:hypothetical protein